MFRSYRFVQVPASLLAARGLVSKSRERNRRDGRAENTISRRVVRVGLAAVVLAVLVVTLLTQGASPAQAQGRGILYAVTLNAQSDLYVLNPANGLVLDGPIAIWDGGTRVMGMTGLAVHPITGDMYGTVNVGFGWSCDPNCDSVLYSIDANTGAATAIGNTGYYISDITFGPSGTLFGWARGEGVCPSCTVPDDLLTIDLATGAASVVGECNCSTGSGEDPGLAADSLGNLYMLENCLCSAQPKLHRINALTGTIISTQPLIPTSYGACTLCYPSNMLAFDPNDGLYTGARVAGLVLQTIDLGTGVITNLEFNGVSNITAIAFDRTHDPVIDVAVDMIVKGRTRAAAKSKTFQVVLANVGTEPVRVSSSHLDVTVEGVGVSCRDFSHTIAPGQSIKTRCAFSPEAAGIVAGQVVDFQALIHVPSDSNPANDSDVELQTAK